MTHTPRVCVLINHVSTNTNILKSLCVAMVVLFMQLTGQQVSSRQACAITTNQMFSVQSHLMRGERDGRDRREGGGRGES